MRPSALSAFAFLTFAAGASAAMAQLPYAQDFATDTASRAETLATYPDWILSTNPTQGVPEDLRVEGGVLEIYPDGNDSRIIFAHDLTGKVVMETDMAVSWPVGFLGYPGAEFVVGPNRLTFTPGFDDGTIRGGFFVFGPYGGPLTSNGEDMGFFPALDVMHHMKMEVDFDSGRIDVEITDGSNAANVYRTTFTNPDLPSYVPAAKRIGIAGSGGSGVALISADNILIRSAEIAVAIDIKPGSTPNCFNVNGHGVIPAAVLGSVSFDVSQIDASTLLLDGMAVRVRGNKGPQCSFGNVNADAFPDLVCQFEDRPENWVDGSGVGTITGALANGGRFSGTDAICIVP